MQLSRACGSCPPGGLPRDLPLNHWSPGCLVACRRLARQSLPLPLGRATPDRASSTELLPELWSPMTAMAGRARSCSTPRARRESMRSMQGRTFSSYWLYRLFSGPWKSHNRLHSPGLGWGSHHLREFVAELMDLLMLG